MSIATTIEDTLRAQLPATFHQHIPALAQVLADVIDGALSPEEAQQRLAATPIVVPILQQLVGTQLAAGQTVLSFGQGNDQRGATITVSGDVAGRDIVHLQVTVTVDSSDASRRTLSRSLVVLTGVALAAFAMALVVVLPQWRGAGKMQNVFNIAVADFGQIDGTGRVRPWDGGTGLRTSIGAFLRQEVAALPALQSKVDVRDEGVDLITGDTPHARAESARGVAERIDATLIIYGNLHQHAHESTFQLEFYINEQKLHHAEELVGLNQVGLPIPSDTTGIGNDLLLSAALQSRTTALSLFLIGLANLSIDRPADAVRFITQAVDVQGWADADGKEVLYLFLGTAYKARNQAGDLDMARAVYSTAIQLSPTYARAYIGLGNVFYEEFVRSGNKDITKLAQARAEYERARAAPDKSAAANVEAKVHLSLGNVYLVQAQTGQIALFANAEQEFAWIRTAYTQEHPQLKPYAAQAAFGLGVLYERRDHDAIRAAAAYQIAINDADDNPGLRQQATDRLARIAPHQPVTGSP